MKEVIFADATIMKLRGLGFSQKEIAKRLKLTQSAISYRISKIKKRVEREGEDIVFFELCTKIYLPKLLRYFNAR